eukprot:TRINITY_DN5430_c0_g1_i2.p1 TRINITY_DN5430_c0_g1~~TRINITY_DN5430_c0_g1_i2.p1  ORF type:complete len:776 (+),score=178.42 TRINITY_DN5430_c0_g1_i2:236-2563(+)
MDLKNLLNDGMSRQQDPAEDKASHDASTNKTDDGNQNQSFPSKGNQNAGPGNYTSAYDLPRATPGNFLQTSYQRTHMNFMPQHSGPTSPSMADSASRGLANRSNDWMGRGSNVSNGPAIPKSNIENFQQPSPFKSEKNNRNGHNTNTSNNMESSGPPTDLRQLPKPQSADDIAVAFRTIERFKNAEISNSLQISTREHLEHNGFQESPSPFLMNTDVYENVNIWQNVWKTETLENLFQELSFVDQKTGKEVKRAIRDVKRTTDSGVEEAILRSDNLTIMHNLSCLNQRKNRNCMGCSPFWKSTQTICEELRPHSQNDLLHYEPEPITTYLGEISTNGSFSPLRVEVLSFDLVHTMYHSLDNNFVKIWGFVSPSDLARLADEDGIYPNISDQKNLIDPQYLEKKAKVIYGIQKVGQTLFIPAGWAHFSISSGRGICFSASWNLLRAPNLFKCRKLVEMNRGMSIYKPLNLSGLCISASYQLLAELENSDNSQEKNQAAYKLMKFQPILKTIILEEVLGEYGSLSANTVLSFDFIIENYAIDARRNVELHSSVSNEINALIDLPLPPLDSDIFVEDEDKHYHCHQCKYILFNTRKTCQSCKNFDLCEGCHTISGRKHPHKMKRHRKGPVQPLIDLAECVRHALSEHEKEEKKEPIKRQEITRLKRDRTPRTTVVVPPPPAEVIPPAKEELPVNMEPDESYADEVINCICGNNKDLGFMISCERCFAWLHGKCVGISKKNEPDQYFCPRCEKKPKNSATKTSPKDFVSEDKPKEYNLV